MKRAIGKTLASLNLKRPLLKVYFFFYNNIESYKSRRRHSVTPKLVARRQKGGVLAVDIRTEHGLGSKMEWCLEVMAYCDEHNLTPAFRFSYPTASADYFSDFFQIKGLPDTGASYPFTRIAAVTELGFAKDYDKVLTIPYANQLIGKWLQVRPFILEEVDAFCQQRFGDKKILGVHYRNTDKVGEAPAVPYERVKKNMEHYIQQYPDTGAVFVSTDDRNFCQYIIEAFTLRPLIFREDYFRSDSSASVHHNKALDKREMNKDALINCLLLSRCHALLKSSSFLSDWSKLFNPSMPVILLNKPFEHAFWFPASAISKEVLYEAL